MRKLLAVLLIASLAAALSGCRYNGNTPVVSPYNNTYNSNNNRTYNRASGDYGVNTPNNGFANDLVTDYGAYGGNT
jgi:hypothetical protein